MFERMRSDWSWQLPSWLRWPHVDFLFCFYHAIKEMSFLWCHDGRATGKSNLKPPFEDYTPGRDCPSKHFSGHNFYFFCRFVKFCSIMRRILVTPTLLQSVVLTILLLLLMLFERTKIGGRRSSIKRNPVLYLFSLTFCPNMLSLRRGVLVQASLPSRRAVELRYLRVRINFRYFNHHKNNLPSIKDFQNPMGEARSRTYRSVVHCA